jgi:hypothetical protein
MSYGSESRFSPDRLEEVQQPFRALHDRPLAVDRQAQFPIPIEQPRYA